MATNWLVLRGTAGESVHARLLAQVLPGYAVDPVGSLIGAAELFVLLYVFASRRRASTIGSWTSGTRGS